VLAPAIVVGVVVVLAPAVVVDVVVVLPLV
jgi:hypothetical protein